MNRIEIETIVDKLHEAESKAIDNLARYKFSNFGYWASTWVHYNRLAVELGVFSKKQPNPFRDFVSLAGGKNE